MNIDIAKNKNDITLLEKNIVLLQLFINKVIREKKTYILILASILPIIRASVMKNVTEETFVYLTISKEIFSFLVLPLICLILGITALTDEKENKTISQLLARPIKRENIVITKWISVIAIGLVITSLDSLIIYLGLCIIGNDFSILLNNLDVLLRVWVYLGLWFMVYGTIFLLIGTLIDKNALGWGIFIAYFEAFFSQFIFGSLGEGNSPFSITNHIDFVASEFLLYEYFNFQIDDFEAFNSLLVCFSLIVVALVLAILVMRRKDFP